MQKRRLGRIVLIIDVRFLGIGSPPESVLPAIADLHSTVPGLSSWLMHRYLLSDPNPSTTAQAHVWLYLLPRVLIFRGVLEFLGFGVISGTLLAIPRCVPTLRGGIASRLSAASFSAETQRKVGYM